MLWDVMPCSLIEIYRRCGKTCCFHIDSSVLRLCWLMFIVVYLSPSVQDARVVISHRPPFFKKSVTCRLECLWLNSGSWLKKPFKKNVSWCRINRSLMLMNVYLISKFGLKECLFVCLLIYYTGHWVTVGVKLYTATHMSIKTPV